MFSGQLTTPDTFSYHTGQSLDLYDSFLPQVNTSAKRVHRHRTRILRVDHMKILGVTIRSDLKMTTHVSEVLAACTCSLYPLRIFRAHGLSGDPLFQVTRATTINRILYAGPAWWGLTSAPDRRGLGDFAVSWRARVVWPRTVLISTR